MATKKSSKTKAITAKKSSTTKPKTASVDKSVKTTKPEVIKSNKVGIKKFFARDYDANENILTIFKSPKIYGAILGEAIGTMLLTILLLTLGLYQPLYVMFGVIAITIAVFAFSGANLNPIVTAGMMARRKMSVIRGVVYIAAQILGAWFGYLLVSAFLNAAGEDTAATLPVIEKIADKNFWVVTMIELVGAIIIGFAFARALVYKRSTFTFAALVGGGMMLALLFAVVVSGNFFALQNNFVLNPAVAFMYNIFPAGGNEFGVVVGEILKALTTFAIFPMIGGVIGFFLADFASFLSCEEIK